ncbi:hypothetical protein IAD21_04867 [Abditibacteriota bacterium]|nr:hypothetical protein IAD21_04867 [Abditibacteriota bacterium]
MSSSGGDTNFLCIAFNTPSRGGRANLFVDVPAFSAESCAASYDATPNTTGLEENHGARLFETLKIRVE